MNAAYGFDVCRQHFLLAVLLAGSVVLHIVLGILSVVEVTDVAIDDRETGRTSVAVQIVAFRPPQPAMPEFEPIDIPLPDSPLEPVDVPEPNVEVEQVVKPQAAPEVPQVIAREFETHNADVPHVTAKPVMRDLNEPPVEIVEEIPPTPRRTPATKQFQPAVEQVAMVPVNQTVVSRQTRGAEVQPRFVSRVDPEYPRDLLLRGVESSLRLRVEVGIDGTAQSIAVVASSGYPAMDRSAIAAVQRWRFTPAKRGGVPVAQKVIVPVNFRIRSR